MTSRLIGSGPIRQPVRASKGQGGVLQAIDHSTAGSMTAQPPGIRPSALRVATHGQQGASLGEGVFYSPSRQGVELLVLDGIQSNSFKYYSQMSSDSFQNLTNQLFV